ncbi:hypothetical protein C8R42DRAFT_712368 [Lentinula raphanica]|nr:hypothetical protein C8R42DRAFT_712368 [Lentinula raphanica]
MKRMMNILYTLIDKIQSKVQDKNPVETVILSIDKDQSAPAPSPIPSTTDDPFLLIIPQDSSSSSSSLHGRTGDHRFKVLTGPYDIPPNPKVYYLAVAARRVVQENEKPREKLRESFLAIGKKQENLMKSFRIYKRSNAESSKNKIVEFLLHPKMSVPADIELRSSNPWAKLEYSVKSSINPRIRELTLARGNKVKYKYTYTYYAETPAKCLQDITEDFKRGEGLREEDANLLRSTYHSSRSPAWRFTSTHYDPVGMDWESGETQEYVKGCRVHMTIEAFHRARARLQQMFLTKSNCSLQYRVPLAFDLLSRINFFVSSVGSFSASCVGVNDDFVT